MSLPVWGVPWHGKVQGGQLQLPNGATLAWQQPDGTSSGAITDHAGYTFLQRLPGVAEVARTPEELAADEAAGREWRNTFIVGGTDTASSASALLWPQIHGKRVGGWIYAAPGGGRWLVNGSGTYNFSQGGTLNIPLRLVRFGDFGASPVTVNLTVSATSAAMGQLTPSVGLTSFSAKVEDITPAGDKAIVMIYGSGKTPLGFLLLSLTGTPVVDFSASLTPLKTRFETLGTVNSAQGASVVSMIAAAELSISTDDQRGPYPSCGYIDTIYTPTAVVRTPEWWEAANVYVGSGDNRLTLTGRVMAMWFDATGAPQPLLLASVQSHVVAAPTPNIAVSGRIVVREAWNAGSGFCGQGAQTPVEYMTTTRSQVVSETVTQTLTLSWAGQQVTAEYVHMRASSMTSLSTDLSDVFPGPPLSRSGSSTDSRSITVDSIEVFGYSDAADGYSNFPYVGPPVAWAMPATNIPLLVDVVVSAGSGATWGASVKRWSNNLIGVRTNVGGVAYAYSQAHTPSGLASPVDPDAAGAYGSWNPATGNAAFPSLTPVNWT